MEADLHAIVRLLQFFCLGPITEDCVTDPVPAASFRRTLPILHLSDSLRSEVYPFCQCAPS